MSPAWWRRRRSHAAATVDLPELLARHDELLRKLIAAGASDLTPEEIAELESAVRARLAENRYEALRGYSAGSSFVIYLCVVVERITRAYREELWDQWWELADAQGLGDAAAALESLVYEWATSEEEALAAVSSTGEPPPDRRALEGLWAARPLRGVREVTDLRWEPPTADRPPGARQPTPLERRIATALHELSAEDRFLLHSHVASGLPLKWLAFWFRQEPEALSRRIDSALERVRVQLTAAGVDATDVRALLSKPRRPRPKAGENGAARPSKHAAMRDEPSDD